MKDIIHAADLPPVVPRLRVEHRGRDPHSLISPSLRRTNCRVRARRIEKYAHPPQPVSAFVASSDSQCARVNAEPIFLRRSRRRFSPHNCVLLVHLRLFTLVAREVITHSAKRVLHH